MSRPGRQPDVENLLRTPSSKLENTDQLQAVYQYELDAIEPTDLAFPDQYPPLGSIREGTDLHNRRSGRSGCDRGSRDPGGRIRARGHRHESQQPAGEGPPA